MIDVRSHRPGPGRPPGTDSSDTRRRVLRAACRCFAESGYGPSTNSQIAELAGVTAGSVHYHFRTKHHLFEAVCEDVYGTFHARMEGVLAGSKPVSGLLRAVLTESMRINHEAPELAGFVATAPVDAARHPELAPAFVRQSAAMFEQLTAAVVRGQEGGDISPDLLPARVVALIFAIANGFAHAAVGNDPAEMDEMNALFDRMLLVPDP